MKVLYNAGSLMPPLTGVGYYGAYLSQAMAQLEDVQQVSYFLIDFLGNRQELDQKLKRDLELFGPGGGLLKRRSIGQWAQILAHYGLLRANPQEYRRLVRDGLTRFGLLKQHSVDQKPWKHLRTLGQRGYVYHETNFLLQPFNGPKVVSIHDLSVPRFPQFHPLARVRTMQAGMAASVQAADRVICGAEMIRDEVIAHFGLDPEKVEVVYHGVDDRFKKPADDQLNGVLARFGLEPEGYILIVGTMEPRKNLARFAAAYAALPQALRANCPLVHAGPPGWGMDGSAQAFKALEAAGHFRQLGYVDLEDLPALYGGCRLFAFPSVYEGFGLPVLEAMACGAPVLTSRGTTMEEVAGKDAFYLAPEDEGDMQRQLQWVLESEQVRRDMAAAGCEKAKDLTWEQAAKKTLAVYQRASACWAARTGQ